ncbi:MAG: Threonylcarbamoyl-AMP synthase [Firmicutes bacterium]|nr:Threonylcarbamoyl-AMP synthase [Bacillota bacterium]
MRVFSAPQGNFSDNDIAAAADILKEGGVVAFPTETVYGLGARYDCETAIKKIFAAKGRPADNPLIVHIAHPEELAMVAQSISPQEEKLMLYFWPGPLTLVLTKNPALSGLVTAGLSTVGVRMPSHPVALRLITAVGVPIVAPSANLSGRPSPTAARHVAEDLAGSIDALCDGGETTVGLESTVARVYFDRIVVLRPGSVTRAMLQEATQLPVVLATHADGVPEAPGMKYVHYAPRAEIFLYLGDQISAMTAALDNEAKVAVIAHSDTLELLPSTVRKFTLGARGCADLAARKLYAYLREADGMGIERILVEGIVPEGLGEAVMNRLRKAASRVIGEQK